MKVFSIDKGEIREPYNEIREEGLKMCTRKMVIVLFVGLMILSLLTGGLVDSSHAARKKGVIIGGCTPVGTYTLVAGMIAKLISKNYPGYAASPLGTAGCSIENIWRIHEKEMEFGLCASNNAYAAYYGNKPFPHKMNVAGVISIYSSLNHLMVLKGRGIKTLADLRGKKINISIPGSFTENFNRTILFPALGMDVDKDIEADLSPLHVALDKMRDGHIDVMSYAGGVGGSYFVDITSSRNILFLPLPEEIVEKILKKNPYLRAGVIPAGSYKRQDEDVLSIGPVNQLLGGRHLSEEFVYTVTKIFFDNIKTVRSIHPLMEIVSAKHSFENVVVPFHPGAAKYYAEQGLKK